MTTRIASFDQYQDNYRKSIDQPEEFWAKEAENFTWRQKWDKVLEWNFDEPRVKWFLNGKLNITENCLDRWAESHPDKVALLWEPNDPDEKIRKYTYKQLLQEVSKVANSLKNIGVTRGDKVCIYMPMVPELTFAVLACARIGAVHSVVFAGFSALSLADRINDASCKVVLTADGLFRGAKQMDLKTIVDDALTQTKSVEKVVVLKRTGVNVDMQSGRDVWWTDFMTGMENSCPPEIMDSEDELFILYTSGSTGKPKGVVHTIGGYMLYTAYSFINVFQYQENDVYWCTADIGWITGHSYIIYGPLLAGATTVMFEGVPTWPDAGRFWEVVEKHKVNIFYTAPTAIRALMAHGTEPVQKHDLSSLKALGTVGEPINEEAWHWYHKYVGKENIPVVDTWWQTETGGILISPLAGITPVKASYATLPLPGIQPVLLDGDGNEIKEAHMEGYLCIKFPWPSILRTTYGDHERCRRNYFERFKGYYFTGDSAKCDAEGNYRIIGRVDDVINVSGHRLGTAEIENAIDEHRAVIESAVVGYPHEIKGQGIYAFVIADKTAPQEEELKREIIEMVRQQIGSIAKPDKIQMVTGLPKTRSGKIMRRILRKIAEGKSDELGDISTLLDPAGVEDIKRGAL